MQVFGQLISNIPARIRHHNKLFIKYLKILLDHTI